MRTPGNFAARARAIGSWRERILMGSIRNSVIQERLRGKVRAWTSGPPPSPPPARLPPAPALGDHPRAGLPALHHIAGLIVDGLDGAFAQSCLARHVLGRRPPGGSPGFERAPAHGAGR